MNIQLDVVTGFLGSGKTTFITAMLQKSRPAKERIVIIQNECGEEEIVCKHLVDRDIHLEKVGKERTFDAGFIEDIVARYSPDRIIIEQNGMQKTGDLLTVLAGPNVGKICKINKKINIIDAATFDIFMNNIGEILIEQISNSDLILLNNVEGRTNDELNAMERTLHAINESAKLARSVKGERTNAIVDAFNSGKSSKLSQPFDKIFTIFILLIAFYLIYAVFKSVDFSTWNIDFSRLQALNTVFLSILIEAFPFILFGVLVSSTIQVLISQETIIKLIPRKMGFGFLVALLSGLVFPVCDCAVIPVAARLVKKGVPLPTAVTFMLAAPIVNPLVIVSTLYAFPGRPAIAFYRVCLGAIIALAVGLSFLLFREDMAALLSGFNDFSCKCGYCGDTESAKGIWSKIEAIFNHAGVEFFDVGRYLITGALLSSIFQTMIPKDIIAHTGGGYALSLMIMMLCAFVLSVCSTSDAFIARTFVSQFPLGAVMGFMILGPMIDIKNLLMLLGRFRKRFVVKLVVIISGLSYALLMFFSRLQS